MIGSGVLLGAALFAGVEVQEVSGGAAARLDAPDQGVLHVAVFATWCPPCVAELDRLAEWEARFGADGYRLVVLAIPERQSAERLRRFHDENHVPGRFLWDPAGRGLRALDVSGVPTHILLGPGGRELWRGGALEELGEAGLEALLAGQPPAEESR
ncbi:MAG TPA: TlpA disulfide reductase family protein [Candidatus Polarisedimenticolaceae bacterium]